MLELQPIGNEEQHERSGHGRRDPVATKLRAAHRKPRPDSGATWRATAIRVRLARRRSRGARFTSATNRPPRAEEERISACGPHVDSEETQDHAHESEPSRHAVTRARPLSSSASRAPHAW